MKGLDFSIMYFSSDENSDGTDKYEFLKESIQFVDKSGFKAVWLPERHFNQFGGIFPSPALLSAAMAMITKNVRLRSGSVILPLHHPIRVAEEWSVTDNLSNGRIDIAFTTGWNARDFVIAPEAYPERVKLTHERIETIQKLWAGKSVDFLDGNNEKQSTKIYPPPIQKKLNIWIT